MSLVCTLAKAKADRCACVPTRTPIAARGPAEKIRKPSLACVLGSLFSSRDENVVKNHSRCNLSLFDSRSGPVVEGKSKIAFVHCQPPEHLSSSPQQAMKTAPTISTMRGIVSWRLHRASVALAPRYMGSAAPTQGAEQRGKAKSTF